MLINPHCQEKIALDSNTVEAGFEIRNITILLPVANGQGHEILQGLRPLT